VVQGDRQLDDTKTSPQVAAGYRYRVDRLGAKFIGQLY
jgi:hypothetical protein